MNNETKKRKLKIFERGSVDILEVIILIILLAAGLIMLYSASIPTSLAERNSASAIALSQLEYVVGGLVIMAVASHVSMDLIKKFSYVFYAIGILMLIIVLFIPDPEGRPGYHRWIPIFGRFTFQPSELMKFFLIIALARVMEKYHNRIVGVEHSNGQITQALDRKKVDRLAKQEKKRRNSPSKRRRSHSPTPHIWMREDVYPTLLCGALIVLPAFLIYKGNHNSGMILLMLLGVIMLFLGDFKRGWFVTAFIVIVVAVVAVILLYKYVEPARPLIARFGKERLIAWLDKDYEPTGLRWQINNSLNAIGSGGLFGVGFSESVMKYYYIPEPQNDMIFPVICEELGFFGASVILIVFAALVGRGMLIGITAKDPFSAYVAMGIAANIAIHVLLNVAVVTDFIPNTGVSLPFFSSGGTALFVYLGEMGVLLSVSRNSRMVKK